MTGSPVERDRRWAQLHSGLDPGSIPGLRCWLRSMWTLARPLVALGLPPTAISVAGAVLACAAVGVVRAIPLLAMGLLALSVLCDGLDGAVALIAERASRAGAIADAVCDRIADLAFAAVIYRCGAPLWLSALTAASVLGIEGWRLARAGIARTTITVAERPTRFICAAVAAVLVATLPAAWPAVVCASVLLGLGALGLAQLGSAQLGSAQLRSAQSRSRGVEWRETF